MSGKKNIVPKGFKLYHDHTTGLYTLVNVKEDRGAYLDKEKVSLEGLRYLALHLRRLLWSGAKDEVKDLPQIVEKRMEYIILGIYIGAIGFILWKLIKKAFED